MANDLSNFTPEIWATKLIERINQINVMLPLVNRNYEGDIKQAGDTVHVRTFGDVTIQGYTKGQPIAYSDLGSTDETLLINDQHYFAFRVDDIDTVQNDINALAGYTERAGVGLSNTIELFLQTAYLSANAANVVDNGGSAITVSASNAYTTLVSAGLALDLFNNPTVDRWAIITPTYKSFLLKDTTYLLRSTDMADGIVISGQIPNGDGTFRPMTVGDARNRGYIGQVAGFNVFVSNAPISDGTARNLMFGQGMPISYAPQINQLEAIRLETTFANAVRGLLVQGKKVFAEDAKRLGYIRIATTQ